LPELEQFDLFVESFGEAGAWCSGDCADLVRSLAYGKFRKTEAANITWNDGHFNSYRIWVRVTKNGSPRSIPMIQDMKALLDRLKHKRPNES
jgi:integrase